MRHVLPVTALLFLFITLPYLFAARQGGETAVFGGFLLNPADGYSYLAKMYQGWEGEWRLHLPYSAEPGQGVYLFLFYLGLGHVSRWSGLSLIVIFHLARLLGALLLAWALWNFVKAYAPQPRWAGWSFSLAMLGLGMGWVVFPLGRVLPDFWVAEGYPLLSTFTNPHFPLGMALLLRLFTFPRDATGSLWREGVEAALNALLLGIISPFGVILGVFVLGGWCFWEGAGALLQAQGRSTGEGRLLMSVWGLLPDEARRAVARLVGFGVAGAPILLYDLWLTWVHPQIKAWHAQNLTPTPPIGEVFVAFLPALLLAPVGVWMLIRKEERPSVRLLLVWFFVAWGMMYLPIGLQRRFMMGLYVPTVLLAAWGLERLGHWLKGRERFLATLALALALPGPLLLLAGSAHLAQVRSPLYYLHRDEVAALHWLQENTPGEALVLCAPQTGLFIPALSGRRVLYGHPFETVNAAQEEASVEAFFEGRLPSANDFVQRRGVDYIFYGPRERALGGLPPGLNAWLVFSSPEVVVFQVATP